jgi:hypothetical protein
MFVFIELIAAVKVKTEKSDPFVDLIVHVCGPRNLRSAHMIQCSSECGQFK